MFWIFNELREFGHKIYAAVCCVICFGPISMIVGIVFLILSANHTRENSISDYTKVVDNWTANASNPFKKASFSISTSSSAITKLPLLTPGPDYEGITDFNKDGIPQYQGAFFQISSYTLSSLTLSFSATNKNGVTSTFTRSVVGYKTITEDTNKWSGCRNSDCSTSTSSSSSSCRSTPTCQSICIGRMGTFSGTSCTYPVVLDSICVRVVDFGSGIQLDTSTGKYPDVGCYYENGFNPGKYVAYTESPVFVQYSITQFMAGQFMLPNGVTVRDASDPFIYASLITTGNYNFGLSTTQKVVIGIVCLATGAVFLALVILTVWLVLRCVKKSQGGSGPATTYFTTSQPVSQPNPYSQQGQQYGSTIPLYSQPAAPYGQPNPYGAATQPGYGQTGYVQPVYSQPQTNYTQGGGYAPPPGPPPTGAYGQPPTPYGAHAPPGDDYKPPY